MKVEITKAEYPRKAPEYAVQILSDEGKYLLCARPYTAYKVEAEIVAKAFEALIASGGESAILQAASELP